MARGTSKKNTSTTRNRNTRQGSTPLPTLGTPSRNIPKDKPTPRYGGSLNEWLRERESPSGLYSQIDRMHAGSPYGISTEGRILNQNPPRPRMDYSPGGGPRVATGGSRRSPRRPRRGGR